MFLAHSVSVFRRGRWRSGLDRERHALARDDGVFEGRFVGIFGDRGWVETREVSNVDIPDPAILTRCGMDEEIHSRTYKHRDVVRANLDAWADAVEGRSEYRFTREEKLHNVQILEAIVTSADTDTTQQIP